MKRVTPKPIRVSNEGAAKLLANFAVDCAMKRYAVKCSIRGRTITFVLTELRDKPLSNRFMEAV